MDRASRKELNGGFYLFVKDAGDIHWTSGNLNRSRPPHEQILGFFRYRQVVAWLIRDSADTFRRVLKRRLGAKADSPKIDVWEKTSE